MFWLSDKKPIGIKMNSDNTKLLVGTALAATWIALVVCKIQGAEDIINAIKIALTGISAYHLTAK